MDLLKQLSEAPGVSGHEEEVRVIVREALAGHLDEFRTDSLGNLIAHRPGKGPAVAIAAHMDEIGFIVSFIEKETGFLRIHPFGQFDPRTLLAQRVNVRSRGGDLVGCIGMKPVHLLTDEEKKKPVELRDLFVDLGMSEERVREKVAVGDMVTLRQEFLAYGDVFSGKALDDRAGIYIGIEAIKRAKRFACDLTFIGTTQEEVGLRGAQVAGFAVKPDIGIALDLTFAVEAPGVPGAEQVSQLGKGVSIKLTDSASISHPALVEAMRRLAEAEKIPYQMEVLPRGGTDAGALQMARGGAAVVGLSLPTRYVHSVVEMAHRADLEAAIALLAAFLESADKVDLSL